MGFLLKNGSNENAKSMAGVKPAQLRIAARH